MYARLVPGMRILSWSSNGAKCTTVPMEIVFCLNLLDVKWVPVVQEIWSGTPAYICTQRFLIISHVVWTSIFWGRCLFWNLVPQSKMWRTLSSSNVSTSIHSTWSRSPELWFLMENKNLYVFLLRSWHVRKCFTNYNNCCKVSLGIPPARHCQLLSFLSPPIGDLSSGCCSLEEDKKLDYKNIKMVNSLIIPPTSS